MSPAAEKILDEIKALPEDEQVALSERIMEEVVDDISAPDRVRVRSKAELIQKVEEARKGSPIPVTPEFWKKHRDRIGNRSSASV